MFLAYRSATQTFTATTGEDLSPQDLQLNILIELRAFNDLALQLQRGLVTETMASTRNEIVNATQLPLK